MKHFPWWIVTFVLLIGCAVGPDMRDFEGKVTEETPFDHKYIRVQRQMRKAAKFKNKRDKKGQDYWQTPEETEERGTGDCEDKALWVYYKLFNQGFNVRLVLGGMYEWVSKTNTMTYCHCWTQWYTPRGIYILDPGQKSRVLPATSTNRMKYHPWYSWQGDKRWKHDRRAGMTILGIGN